MLVQYTSVSSLTIEQRARLKAYVSNATFEGQGFITFEGMTLSKQEVYAYFPRTQAPKPPGQLLQG